jgi:hypothetical protein
MYTREQINAAVLSKGYKWFEDENKLNIVSVRNSAPGTKVTNVFDDTLTLSFKKDGVWQYYSWVITTDPGTKAVKEYHNANGVAILVPGQYIDSHTIRLHQGKYEAVCQAGVVKVFRDKNKDMKFDMDPKTIVSGVFGINIHRSNPTTESTFVENWSEGCSVFKRVKDFNEFMKICNSVKAACGNKFTYTLLTSADVK